MKIATLIFGFFAFELASFGQTYQYDTARRLANVVYADGTRIGYSYDAAGNRLAQSVIALPQVANQTIAIDQTGRFTAIVYASPTPAFAWQVSTNGGATWSAMTDAGPYNGATTATLTISGATVGMNGYKYRCTATNSAGSTTSATATLTVSEGFSRLANISVRAPAGTGDQTLILGFYIGGTGSKQVLIRGIGPSLAQYNVSGALADPQLRMFDSNSIQIDQNDDWGGSTILSNAFASVYAFALPTRSKDAAMLVTLPPNGYTAQVNGAGVSTGVSLIEAYETDTNSPTARFIALSARNQVGTGDNILVVGFVVTGNEPKTLLIRGIGPTLANYAVSGVLADPQLALFNSSSTKIAENDNWNGEMALSNAFAATGAFPLPTNSKDAVLLVTLQPGLYSAQVSGVGGTTGVSLVEVYEVP